MFGENQRWPRSPAHRLFLDDVVVPTARRDTWIIWRADVFRWLDTQSPKPRLNAEDRRG